MTRRIAGLHQRASFQTSGWGSPSAPTSAKIATARLSCAIASSGRPGGVEEVGEVVVQRGLAVAVALGRAELERGAGQLERRVELAARAVREREVVERGDAGAGVAGGLGEGEAAAEVLERVGRGAAAGGEGAEQVVGLAERARVAGGLRQRAGALGELGGARRVAAVVGAQRRGRRRCARGSRGRPRPRRRARPRSARSASAHSPRRWRTWPSRCSIGPSPAGAAVGRGRLVGRERRRVLALRASAGRRSRRAARPGRDRRARAQRAGARARPRWRTASARARPRAGMRRRPRRRGRRAQVARDLGGRARQRIGRAAVEQPPAGEARLLGGEPAQLLVREVVVVATLADQPPADQLLQRADRLLVAAAADRRGRCRRRRSARSPRPRRGSGAPVSLTGSSRASSSSRAPAGSAHSGSAPSESRYSTSRNGRPSVSS